MALDIPLTRSGSTDRIYRVNTGSNRLMRALKTEYNTMNLGCFLPSGLPIWTEGQIYNIGDIIYGRYEISNKVYTCGVFECGISHTADQTNKPSGTSSMGYCNVSSTLYWKALGSTTLIEYPPCGSLASDGALPYGGINKSPTGVLVGVSGITPKPDHLDYPEIAWHHDYNGIFCLPAHGSMYGASGSAWTIGGYMNGDLSWALEFQRIQGHGDCEEGTHTFKIRHQKRTISDNWWTWTYLFCGSHEIDLCETSYTIDNLFLPPPYFPYDWWDTDPAIVAWRQSLQPTVDCTGYDDYGNIPPFSGWSGTVSLLGFTDYLTVGYDDRSVEYLDNGKTIKARWRFALYGSSGKRAILKNNIACDFFRFDFQGVDWDVFLGCTTIPVTPDGDGWYEHTETVPEGVTVSDCGITNINAYNWRYKSVTDMLGSIRNS